MRIEITPAIAYAAGRDAGTRAMRAAGRTTWNRRDYTVAARTTGHLLALLSFDVAVRAHAAPEVHRPKEQPDHGVKELHRSGVALTLVNLAPGRHLIEVDPVLAGLRPSCGAAGQKGGEQHDQHEYAHAPARSTVAVIAARRAASEGRL